MNTTQIHLDDFKRIFFGDTSPEFMFEVFLRTCFIFLAFLLVMRLLGKRMSGQLTIIEMAINVTLGAIISPAMQLSDRGLLMGITALICALLFQWGVNFWGFKNRKVEQLVQGHESLLVKNGVLQLDNMAKNRVSRQQLFSALRSQNVYNLSKVKRLYLEAYGMFTTYTSEEEKPGLSTLPGTDKEVHSIQRYEPNTCACTKCGNTVPARPKPGDCAVCGENEWVEAYI